MDHQTSLNSGNGRAETDREPRGVADLLHDLAEMAELQMRLLAVDAKAALSRARWAAGMLVFGAWLALATVPMLLLAVAAALIQAGMGAGWACLIAAAIGAVVGGGLLFGAWLAIRRSIAPFRRSRDEFARNYDWFKRALRPRPRAGSAATRTAAGSSRPR